MKFAEPFYLVFLLIIPVVSFVAYKLLERNRKTIEKAFGTRVGPFLISSVSWSARKRKIIFRSMVLLFSILALARPQVGGSKQNVKSQGVELMILMDVSESMMAEDARPNRLTQAKMDMTRLLDLIPGSKVGVIAFAGASALMAPLSNDPSAIKMYIDSLTSDSVSTQGTNFEFALEEAKAAFERGTSQVEGASHATRVVLVVSDGEDHEKGAQEKAEQLVKSGIRIFSVAYGTAKGAAIPVRDSLGYHRGYKKDRAGNTVLTQVKGDALKVLAEYGKGSFYHASGGDHVRLLAEDIDKLEKAEFDSSIVVQYEERFQIFLFIALLFAFLDLLTGERKSNFRLWRGRFEVPPA